MAKKPNTLNDLASFLKSESIGGAREFTSEVEKDFFQKKPLSLVDIENEKVENLQEVNKTITSEKNNKLSEQEIVANLESLPIDPLTSFYTWSLNFQLNYFKFLLDFQKGFLGK